MEEINAVRSLFNGASVPEIILTVGVSLLFLAYGIYRGINYYRESVRRQERLRELFPDVSRGVRHFDFTYKGFEACLDWKNREEEYFSSDDEIGHSTMPHTYFKVFMPDKLQKKIRALGFKMRIEDKSLAMDPLKMTEHPDHFYIDLNTSHPMMENLPADEIFSRALSDLKSIAGMEADITLKGHYFLVHLPIPIRSIETLANFGEIGAQLFERVITAAATADPELQSIPPIAGNFTIRSGKFLNECSDEAMYDALDDGAPAKQNSRRSRGGWGKTNDMQDDERALPEQIDN